MRTPRNLHIALSILLLAATAQAAPNKPAIEVIDLDPPPHKTNLPEAPAPATEATEAATPESPQQEPAPPPPSVGPKTATLTAIEEKKARRLEAIRSFFGKMKSEVEGAGVRPAPAEELPPEPAVPRPARATRPSAADTDTDTDADADADAAPARTSADGYRVQRGDTLAKISKKFFGTTRKFSLIADANNLSPMDRIHVGQDLIIPADDSPSRPAAAAPRPAGTPKKVPSGVKPATAPRAAAAVSPPVRAAAAAPPVATGAAPRDGKLDYASYDFKLYQIQAGDTLASVADKFYHGKGDPSLIRLYNPPKSAFKPGDKILIPLPKRDGGGRPAQKGT